MRPPREVAFFTPYAGPLVAGAGTTGGAETQLFLLARALRRRGRSVALAVLDVPDGLPAEVEGVEVVGLPTGRPRLLAAMVRDLDADVLVQRAAGTFTGIVGTLARVRRRRFVYSTASDLEFHSQVLAKDRGARVLFPLGIRCADAIVVQTDAQAELCRRQWRRPCAVIRSLCEPHPLRTSPPEALLWIGRMAPYKRPEVFAELAARLPAARFWMVGGPSDLEPELYARVYERARRLPNLELLPVRPRDELGELIERATAIVSTSVAEGMPNVLLEGWSRGVPALTLSHDPDAVIRRHGLGWCADGSVDRLVELAGAAWEARDDQAEVATRCRDYVGSVHAPDRIAADWERALGFEPRAG
jgi:glycosyltransferase involved in cell wall biosynthesis